MRTIWRVAGYLFRYKKYYWLTIACAVASIGFALTIPEIAGYIVNGIEQGTVTTLIYGVVIMVLCYSARELFNMFRIRINNYLEQKVLTFGAGSDLWKY